MSKFYVLSTILLGSILLTGCSTTGIGGLGTYKYTVNPKTDEIIVETRSVRGGPELTIRTHPETGEKTIRVAPSDRQVIEGLLQSLVL